MKIWLLLITMFAFQATFAEAAHFSQDLKHHTTSGKSDSDKSQNQDKSPHDCVLYCSHLDAYLLREVKFVPAPPEVLPNLFSSVTATGISPILGLFRPPRA